jgi:putative alpha-1,2-mannosidase
MMIGNHAIPVIVDAYLKGIKNFDVDLAYRACKESSMVNSRELDAYKKIGYVPVGIKTRIGLYQNLRICL